MIRFLPFLSALLFACAPSVFEPDDSSVSPVSEGLSFRSDPEDPDLWQLWWRGEADETLTFDRIRFLGRRVGTLPTYEPVDVDSIGNRSRCTPGVTPLHYEPEEGVRRLSHAGMLRSLQWRKLPPGDYRVEVTQSDGMNIVGDFAIAGISRTDLLRLDRHMEEMLRGVCEGRPNRVRSLAHHVLERIDSEALRAAHRDGEDWLRNAPSTLKRSDLLAEIAVRPALSSYFGSLITQSFTAPTKYWSVARAAHQPFFIGWVEQRLQYDEHPSTFSRTVLERGGWTPKVMDFLANRILYLRAQQASTSMEQTRTRLDMQLQNIAHLLDYTPNEFGTYYPDEVDWVESEYPRPFGTWCGSGRSCRSLGLLFGGRDSCDEAIEMARNGFGLAYGDPPPIELSQAREQLLGI